MSRSETWHTGYILHTRPFRETSVIVDAFTATQGRVSLVYRGVKKSSGKQNKARLLQPFQPLSFLWQGDRELKTGKKFESDGAGYFLTGTALYSALYVNELLLRLLLKEDPHPELFRCYKTALNGLQQASSDRPQEIEITLRQFEWHLLSELGYEITLDKDYQFEHVRPEECYRYDPELGFVPTSKKLDPRLQQQNFSGELLLAISQQQWHDQGVLAAAKRLMRQALQPHLGDKPLESRQLFRNKQNS